MSSRGLSYSTGHFLKNVIFFSGIGDLICHSRLRGDDIKSVSQSMQQHQTSHGIVTLNIFLESCNNLGQAIRFKHTSSLSSCVKDNSIFNTANICTNAIDKSLIISSVCAGVGIIRRRSVPLGTVGKLIC